MSDPVPYTQPMMPTQGALGQYPQVMHHQAHGLMAPCHCADCVTPGLAPPPQGGQPGAYGAPQAGYPGAGYAMPGAAGYAPPHRQYQPQGGYPGMQQGVPQFYHQQQQQQQQQNYQQPPLPPPQQGQQYPQQQHQPQNQGNNFNQGGHRGNGNGNNSRGMDDSERSQGNDRSHGRRAPRSESNDSGSDAGGAGRTPANVTLDHVHDHVGRVVSAASRSHGSSFLQAALRQYPIEAFEVIYKEVAPVMGKLLLDKHACYVVKMVLEMMDKEEAIAHLDTIAVNEELLLTLCTKDLHSRRMIQFILDFAGAERSRYLLNLVMTRPMRIVRTQQGCITLQRILDHFPDTEKEAYFGTVRSNFMEYALDPFGNYIIQYMLTEGNQVENSNTLALYCRGQLHNMICHKYASNVIEKCFGLVTPELQHDIIEEMFNAPEPSLRRVLTDSSANYVVQAAIRAASFRDVTTINERISPLLPSIPYGKKIQQRLNRRLNQK